MKSIRNPFAAMRRPVAVAAGMAVAMAGLVPVAAQAAGQPAGSQPAATETYAGTFSGTVKTPSGKGAKWTPVALVKGTTYKWGTYTDTKGRFKFRPLITASYKAKIGVNRFSGESRYIGGYWAGNGKKITPSYSKAKTVTVAKGKNLKGIRPVLTTCASVSGTVKNGNQHTMVLVLNDADKRLVTRSDLSIGKTGKYTVRGLTKGRYYVVAVQYNGDRYIDSFRGTKSGKKPSKPNLVVNSCKAYKNVDFKAKKVITPTSSPRIVGTYEAGKTLTAIKGKYDRSGLKISYQWYRDGHKIAGATSRYYKVTAADLPYGLSVRVIARKAGCVSAITQRWAVT